MTGSGSSDGYRKSAWIPVALRSRSIPVLSCRQIPAGSTETPGAELAAPQPACCLRCCCAPAQHRSLGACCIACRCCPCTLIKLSRRRLVIRTRPQQWWEQLLSFCERSLCPEHGCCHSPSGQASSRLHKDCPRRQCLIAPGFKLIVRAFEQR